jgi:hypothetical protein
MTEELLLYNINLLKRQLELLEHSYKRCKEVDLKTNITLDELDKFEVLCSRFSKGIDFLVRKVFRCIDDVEFETQGTLIDTVNRAHKRNLFGNLDEIKLIKDLRNEIVHEYVESNLPELFEEVLENTPKLIKIIETTIQYVEDRYGKSI